MYLFACIIYSRVLLLIPKILLKPKIGWLLFGQLVWRFFIFFSTFSSKRVNYKFHKLFVNTKHVKFRAHFSYIFWGAPTCSYMVEVAQGLKGRVLRKKFVLSIESWFSLFSFFFLLMVLHDVTFNLICFNVTASILMWSFWLF